MHIIRIYRSIYLYELILRGATIVRITRYCETNSNGLAIPWEDLDEDVQDEAREKIEETQKEN